MQTTGRVYRCSCGRTYKTARGYDKHAMACKHRVPFSVPREICVLIAQQHLSIFLAMRQTCKSLSTMDLDIMEHRRLTIKLWRPLAEALKDLRLYGGFVDDRRAKEHAPFVDHRNGGKAYDIEYEPYRGIIKKYACLAFDVPIRRLIYEGTSDTMAFRAEGNTIWLNYVEPEGKCGYCKRCGLKFLISEFVCGGTRYPDCWECHPPRQRSTRTPPPDYISVVRDHSRHIRTAQYKAMSKEKYRH